MSQYQAPLREMRFALALTRSLALDVGRAQFDDADAVLDEGARLAERAFAPINALGDRNGCAFENGQVATSQGFRDAYSQYAEGGWVGIGSPTRVGGQGLDFATAIAFSEMINAANMSLAMGLMPAPGAIELIDRFGTDKQKSMYLPNILSGRWSATMVLTEPQAGSDLGAIATKATVTDGCHRLRGRKTLITWGDQDISENIVHLVLARSPIDGPGVRGLSLYLVRKVLDNGEKNDVRCIGLEKKMGLRASPTASLVFGEEGGVVAELLGEENKGLEQIFVLLNQARIRVAAFALGSAERSLQAAIQYAHSRVQGRNAKGEATAISEHPDVARMLISMEARTEAIRALIYYSSLLVEGDKTRVTASDRKAQLELLTPIVKAWCTETAFDVASNGMQVFGGIGYSDDCEASQYFREARVHMIYEGTTGIQANDLIFRKIRRDAGRAINGLVAQIEAATRRGDVTLANLRAAQKKVRAAAETLKTLVSFVVSADGEDVSRLQSNGAHLLMFSGWLLGCWLSIEAVQQAYKQDDASGELLTRKIRNACFLVEHYLAPAEALALSALRPVQDAVLEPLCEV